MKKILTSLLLLAPSVASAQSVDDWGVNDFNGNINIGSRDLRETLAGVINVVLGFLGILTTLLILWGGFKWMTSYGSSDKVDEAKKLMGAGVAGLVIVLVAYAVSRYVLSQLAAETI